METRKYLWGHVFRSSSVDFNTRSTIDWLLGGGKGEGSSSIDHNLFLANPCCSSAPKFATCNGYYSLYFITVFYWEKKKKTKKMVLWIVECIPEESKWVCHLLWILVVSKQPAHIENVLMCHDHTNAHNIHEFRSLLIWYLTILQKKMKRFWLWSLKYIVGSPYCSWKVALLAFHSSKKQPDLHTRAPRWKKKKKRMNQNQ